MNRREALEAGLFIAGGLLLAGCLPKKDGETVLPVASPLPIPPSETPTAIPTKTPIPTKEGAPTPSSPENDAGTLAIVNQWGYTVKFDFPKFYNVTDKFGVPYPKDKATEIILTSETKVYGENGKTQSHTVVHSNNETPDVIRISCGRYQELADQLPGDVYVKELFMSQALTESIIDGLADLAALKGEMTEEQANQISVDYNNLTLSLPPDALINYIFSYVIIPGDTGNYQT